MGSVEEKCNHLKMIQGVVNRLSNNSFLLKGWSVILISGLFALSAKDSKVIFIYISYLPCAVFWGLDGYFLRQERMFRKLYDKVRTINEKEIDYSMDVSSVECEVNPWRCVVISKTLLAFHGVMMVTILCVMLITMYFS